MPFMPCKSRALKLTNKSNAFLAAHITAQAVITKPAMPIKVSVLKEPVTEPSVFIVTAAEALLATAETNATPARILVLKLEISFIA